MATLGHACRQGAKQAEKVRPRRPRGRGGELPCAHSPYPAPPSPREGASGWAPVSLGSAMPADSRMRHHPLCARLLHGSLEEEVCLV